MQVRVEINGKMYERDVEPRLLLSDFVRHEAGLTGTHVGCEHGVCGACTLQIDGEPVRSCLMFAVQAQGRTVRTVEALNEGLDGALHPLQQAFHETHGLQCGFCTPGFLMAALPIYRDAPNMTDEELRIAIGGQLCRCTGYVGIVDAIRDAGERAAAEPTE